MSEHGPLQTVRLIGLPLPLHARAREHGESLRREFRLMADQSAMEPATTPERLLEITSTINATYSGFSAEQEDAIEAAIEAGEATIDLTFQVPRSAAEAATALGRVLDEADEYCRQGKYMLTLATPPDLREYRGWYLSQFIEQLAGDPPRAWPT
jgi:hypothetical protein